MESRAGLLDRRSKDGSARDEVRLGAVLRRHWQRDRSAAGLREINTLDNLKHSHRVDRRHCRFPVLKNGAREVLELLSVKAGKARFATL
jgi:hypothetical protein